MRWTSWGGSESKNLNNSGIAYVTCRGGGGILSEPFMIPVWDIKGTVKMYRRVGDLNHSYSGSPDRAPPLCTSIWVLVELYTMKDWLFTYPKLTFDLSPLPRAFMHSFLSCTRLSSTNQFSSFPTLPATLGFMSSHTTWSKQKQDSETCIHYKRSVTRKFCRLLHFFEQILFQVSECRWQQDKKLLVHRSSITCVLCKIFSSSWSDLQPGDASIHESTSLGFPSKIQ
jgi:hypothetical protein